MARNVFGLALLAALALSGCSKLDNLPFLGNKKAKAAEAHAAALRARTDPCPEREPLLAPHQPR